MPYISRSEVLARLRKKLEEGVTILGTGAGTGISAKFEEAGGSDMIIIYNSGRYRMAGRGSAAGLLAYGDANAIVMEMADEILPVVKNTPVLAGVNGTDPFREMPRFLHQIRERGFSGIQNFPSVGSFDGRIRAELEQTGMSFRLEVDMVREANRQDIFTTPYAWDVEEAKWMADAGADVIVAHSGCTLGGSIGMEYTLTLEESANLTQKIHDAAVSVNPDVIVMCHGGPIAMPEDAEYILQHTEGVHGFYGASSAERLPVEKAIREQIEHFKEIRFR